MAAENLMFSTVSVTRQTYGQDASLGMTSTPTTVYDSIPANVQPARGEVQMQYAQRNLKVSHTVFFASMPTIENGDLIAFGSINLRVIGMRDLISLGRVLAVDALEYLDQKAV